MPNQLEDNVALVLSGAVAQGAFEAGALTTLAAMRPRVVQIAGTSSGALNATVVAAGVATGNLEGAVAVLKRLWVEDASWSDIADAPVNDWLHIRGAFDTRRLQGIVQGALGEVVGKWQGQPTSVTLTLVTTNLNGLSREGAAVPLPTYEQAIVFSAEQIVDRANWPRLATAAAASATLPILFSPTQLDGAPCIDGGAVNNAPISYVLDDASVRTVVVMTTESSQVRQEARSGGLDLAARVAASIINERVAYDLAAAKKANARYAAVSRALNDAAIPQALRQRVLDALGYRPVALYLVQPDVPLRGNAFSGFFKRQDRSGYVDAGARAPMVAIGV